MRLAVVCVLLRVISAYVIVTMSTTIMEGFHGRGSLELAYIVTRH